MKTSTLPKWARDRIDVLEQDLASAHQKLAQAGKVFNRFKLTEEVPCSVSRDHWAEEYVSLPDHTRVQFWLKAYGRPTNIEVYQDDQTGRLVVRSEHSIAVRPCASNTFEVQVLLR